jgi:inner membrane protein
MLPPSHVAYSWLALSFAQKGLDAVPDADYRLVALAAMGPDLFDKPLAWAYFYKRYRAAVLFAHTLLLNILVIWFASRRFPRHWVYIAAYAGHGLLDRLWLFPNTFYWPLRGWRFHEWRRQGPEQDEIGSAYWHAFTRRRELWIWELGGLLALAWFIRRHRLYRPQPLWHFVWTGRTLH